MSVLDLLLQTHSFVVKLLLFGIIFSLISINLTKNSINRFAIFMKISFLLFWAFWAMLTFSGLVTLATIGFQFKLITIIMIVASIILATLEIFRAFKIKKLLTQDLKQTIKLSNIIFAVELLILILVVILSVKLK